MMRPSIKAAKVRTKNPAKIKYDAYRKGEQIGIGLTYHIKTYGCQMNEHDSENIGAMLEEMGFKQNNDYETSDLVILNSCAIRENVHDKVYGMLSRLKNIKEKKNPNLIIGLCGCMSQEENVIETILNKYKYVNFVFGTHNIYRLPKLLTDSLAKNEQVIEVFSEEGDVIEHLPVKRDNKYKAWVNIMFGCDKFCTYCIVPQARGKQRSRLSVDIVREVAGLVNDGYSEVTLLGQNVNAYGKDLKDDVDMAGLLASVAKTGIKRVRFMTSHPWDFNDEMIDVIATYDNIMPFVHLPVQSGSDRILKLMGRRYTKAEYIELYNKLKKRIPGVKITTDVIVGFPGETETDFNDTLELYKACKFDLAYTFIYSPREGTAAAKMPDDVSKEIKKARLQTLNKIVNGFALENNQDYLGKTVPVLLDSVSPKDKNTLAGYTETMKLVNVKANHSYLGKIVPVKITKIRTWSLNGELDE